MSKKIEISILKNDVVNCEVVKHDFNGLCGEVVSSDWSQSLFEGNYRKAANFKSAEIVALDIDDGLPIEDAINRFEDYKHIIATTKSHNVDKNGKVSDRYRIILFLDGVITSKEAFKATWDSLYKICPEIDTACKDVSRYWSKSVKVVSTNPTGNLISIIHSDPKKVAPTAVQKSVTTSLSKETLELLGIGVEEGSRNQRLFKAAKDVKSNGWPLEKALEKLPQNLIADDFTIEEASRTIHSAYNGEDFQDFRNSNVYRWKQMFLNGKIVKNIQDPSEMILVHGMERIDVHANVLNEALNKKEIQDCKDRGSYILASFEYNPNVLDIIYPGKSCLETYNRYIPPTWLSENVTASKLPLIYEKFFKHLTNNDQKSFDYLIDWLSVMVNDRNFTILTTIGTQGVGKGILGEIMEKLVGETNFNKCRDTVLKTKFNGHVEGKRLVYIDEVDIKSNKGAHDRIKDLVNPKLELERKGKDPQMVNNHASIYMSSNSWDAIRIEAGNRRFSIIELTDTKIIDTDLRDKIVSEILNDKNIVKLGKYLQVHKVVNDMKKPFVESARYQEILNEGTFEWENFIINDWAVNNPLRECTIDVIQELLKEKIGKGFNPPGRRKFEELAKKFPDKLKVTQRGTTRYLKSQVQPGEVKAEGLSKVDELLETAGCSETKNSLWDKQFGHIEGMSSHSGPYNSSQV